MLIEFSIANYKSIKDRQTFSMMSSVGKKIDEKRNIHSTHFNAIPNLIETAAIYGKNGAGKSNFVIAMNFFKNFVISSAKDSQKGEKIEVEPFFFSKKMTEQPSEFEVIFIHAEHLFQYGFIADSEIIHSEWLFATPQNAKKQKAQTWFTREKQNIKIKSDLAGEKELWKKSTRDNALFLSTANILNSQELAKPLEWIQKRFKIIKNSEIFSESFTTRMIDQLGDNSKEKFNVLNLLKHLDITFEDIHIEKTKIDANKDILPQLPEDMPSEIKNDILKRFDGKEKFEVFFKRKMEEGGYYNLPLHKESDGTQKIYALAGPIVDILNNGYIFLIDEICNSLHPLALKALIELFQNKEINKNNAQLIFTTHNTDLMNFFEREQIFILEKGEFGNTTINQMSDFEGSREEEAKEKRYLSGRYKGIPIIKEISDVR